MVLQVYLQAACPTIRPPPFSVARSAVGAAWVNGGTDLRIAKLRVQSTFPPTPVVLKLHPGIIHEYSVLRHDLLHQECIGSEVRESVRDPRR